MAESADQEGPQPAWLDLLVVTDQVEEAVLDGLVPGVVPEHWELFEHRLIVIPVPRYRVFSNRL